MTLTEQNLEYVLESVVQRLIDEEIEIDEELLDECLEQVLSEISSGLAKHYIKKSSDDIAKKEAKARYHDSLTWYNDGAADETDNAKESSRYRRLATQHNMKRGSLENKAFKRSKSQDLANAKLKGKAKVPTKG